MTDIVISGTGLYTRPSQSRTRNWSPPSTPMSIFFNSENADAIAAGEFAPLQHSSAEFVEGFRHQGPLCDEQDGILDPRRMVPRLPERPTRPKSIQCEMAVVAARNNGTGGQVCGHDIDVIDCRGLNIQRAYPLWRWRSRTRWASAASVSI